MTVKEISNIVMAIVYLGSGGFLVLGENIFNFSELQKIGLGVLLILYGLFRVYSFIKKLKERISKNEE
ncbi:MAG TPA: hypothetical protein VF870_01160 [Ignavibacteriaceae bacterium]